MSDALTQAPVPETKIIILKRRMRAAIGVMSWIVPFIIMAICFALFKPLRLTVSWPWNAPSDVFIGLFFELVLVVAWFIVEMYYAANRETSVRQLQVDGVVSTFFGHFLTFFAAMMICLQILPWWYLLPWIGVIADSFGSSYFAINNAAQKPLVQNEQRPR